MLFIVGAVFCAAQSRGAKQNFGFIDPNIYTGLAMRYQGLLSELDVNYYSTRVWHILPLKIAFDYFGYLGPVVHLCVLAGLTTTITFRMLDEVLPNQRPFLKFGYSLMAICVPSYFFDSMWTDEGISYIVAILACLYFASNFMRSRQYLIGSGFMAVVTVNIHLKSAGLIAVIGLSILLIGLLNKIDLKYILINFGLGITASIFVTELIFQIMNPKGFWPISWYYQVSLFLRLSQGTNGEWVGLWRLFQIGSFPVFVLAPIIGALYLTAVWGKFVPKQGKTVPLQIQIYCCFGILGTIMLFIYQEVLKFPVVTTFWYYGTFNVVLVSRGVSILWLHYEGDVKGFRISSILFWVLPLATVLPVWVILPGSSLHLSQYRHQIILVSVAILVGSIILWSIFVVAGPTKKIALVMLLLFNCLAISQYGNRAVPFRWRDLGDFGIEKSLFLDEFWLLDIWSSVDGDNRQNDVAIWYENDPNGYLGSIQSALIFADTRLTLANTIDGTSISGWKNLNGHLRAVIYIFQYGPSYNVVGRDETIHVFDHEGCVAQHRISGGPPSRPVLISPSYKIGALVLRCEDKNS